LKTFVIKSANRYTFTIESKLLKRVKQQDQDQVKSTRKFVLKFFIKDDERTFFIFSY